MSRADGTAGTLSFVITSYPDRDDLVAELLLEGKEVGYVAADRGRLALTIFAGAGATVPVADLLSVLVHIMDRLPFKPDPLQLT